jgi:hypothetical protein
LISVTSSIRRVEKPWVANQAILKSKELASLALTCLPFSDFHELSRAGGPKRQIGLPLVEPIKGIVVGAEVLGHPVSPSNGAVEHPTKCDTIDRSRMDTKPNDPARKLIHDHQDPVGPPRGRLAPEQIHTPETVFPVAQERQPGRAVGVLSRPVVMGENPSNHVFVDFDVEGQGDLLGDSGTAPVGITLLHLNDHMDEFCAWSFRAGLPTAFRGEQQPVLLLAHGFVKA